MIEAMRIEAARSERQDFEWGNIAWIVSRALGNSEKMTLGRVTFKAGRANAPHRHPNCDEILHVLSGQLEHVAGDLTVTLRPGDTIVIPQGIRHYATASQGEDAVAIITFSSADRQTEPA